MKRIIVISYIVFVVTLLSPIIAFTITCYVGEVDIFGIPGITRYSWIMWIFTIFGILSLFLGKMLKKNNLRYKKNFICAFISMPMLLIFGSYRFIFMKTVDYDVRKINEVESSMGIELPSSIKIGTLKTDSYFISYIKIIGIEDNVQFKNSVYTDLKWIDSLDTRIEGILPFEIRHSLTEFDYFSFYNQTKNEYNRYPSNGEHRICFAAYDFDANRIIAVVDYDVTINQVT